MSVNPKISGMVYRLSGTISLPVESAGNSSRLATGATLTTCQRCVAGLRCAAVHNGAVAAEGRWTCWEKHPFHWGKKKPSAPLCLSFSFEPETAATARSELYHTFPGFLLCLMLRAALGAVAPCFYHNQCLLVFIVFWSFPRWTCKGES